MVLALGIYHGDNNWFKAHEFSWFPDAVFMKPVWQPQNQPSFKLTHKIHERVSLTPDEPSHVGQASAVYHAQLLKRNPNTEKDEVIRNNLIMKIFMR